ncbi:MAG: methyl-accepting chemotaxis protein, partial [Proteobacteria bacterium]|nr:methyl-accepting chemotaxis protein [Pseudomonadota bacterium]
MKVRVQLLGGFGLVVLLMIVSIGFGLSRMGQIQDRMDDIVGDKVKKANAITDMLDAVREEGLAMRNMALTTDSSLNQEMADRVKRARDAYDKSEQYLQQSVASVEGKAFLTKTIELKQTSRPLNDQATQLGFSNKNEEAAALIFTKVRPPNRQWMDTLGEFRQHENESAQQAYAEAQAAYSSALFWVICLGTVAGITAAALGFFIARNIVRKLGCEPAEAAEIASRVAVGDLTCKLDAAGKEQNSLYVALKRMVDEIKSMTADAELLSRAAVEGKLATRADAGKHEGDFRKIVQGVNDTLDAVIGPLNVAAGYVDEIAKGNLPPKITDSYNGDFNVIKNNLNACIDAIGQQASAAQAIAEGDFSVKVNVRSEGDVLSKSLVRVTEVLLGLQKELQRLTVASREGQLSERGKPEQFKGAYADVVRGVNDMLDAILIPIGEGNRILAQISDGKIDELIAQTYKGDHEKMKQAVNNVATALQGLQKELQRLTEASREGQLSERGKPEQFKGAYADVIRGTNEMLDAILIPIGEGNRVLRLIRGGDLREKVEIACKGDHEQMKLAINGVHGWLTQLIAYVTKIANGDMGAEMAKASDDDQIHEWLMLLKRNIQSLVADANMLAQAAVAGKLATRADASKHHGDYRKIVEGVNETLDAVIGPLNVAADYVDKISKGAIPPKITDTYNGDFNVVKNNLNAAIDNVNALVADANMLAQAAVAGKLATRADASKHQGDYRKIVEGVNQTLDAVIGPLN